MARQKQDNKFPRPALVKSRYTGISRDEAEAFAAKIVKQGGLAWVAEEWGPDMGNPHAFWGFRVTWISYRALRGHVDRVERQKALAGKSGR